MSSDDNCAWALYADLQYRSRKATQIDPTGWGIEAGMNYLLDLISTGAVPVDPEELKAAVERAIRSGARLQRSRNTALTSKMPIDDPPRAADDAADARLEMARILRVVSPNDQGVLMDTAVGYSSREVAFRHDLSPGAVRTRLSRLRAVIAA